MEPGAGAGAGGKEAASRPLTAEEEAVKRNTDCVYFLASPLTCKKGNDCEYRHSEGARVNPRDCWYWLNGNCLNPKCSFRHPPLEGLFGNPGTTSLPAPSPSQTVSAAHVPALNGPASYNQSKPSVPCYFFQKGQCLKGDRCPFMHEPQPAGTPVPQQVAKVFASVTESTQTLKEPWGPKESITQQNIPIPRASVEKPIAVLPSSAKSASKIESVHNNGLAHKRSISPYPLESELPRSQPTNVPVSSGNVASLSRIHQSEPVDERPQNGRDADEFLGESSPGFDVLVDDDIKDSDYLHNEDDFGRESGQDGRNLYPGTDFNYHHSEYEPVPSFEREQYNGMDEHDRYGRIHSSYGREQQRTSSERIMDRHLMPERRVQHREGSPEKMDGSDLRHRLLKQRRINISRSANSPDHRGEPYRRDDRYTEEERYRGRHSHRDRRHFPSESSLSTRLKGRIKLPVRSSPDWPVDYRSEKETDRGRHRGRFSPARPTDYHGRHHDKMKQRSQEDFATDARNLRGQPMRRDEADPLNFVGPKSLAELKGVKTSGDSQEQSTKSINDRFSPDQRSMKSGKAVDGQESEGSHSFEATKPQNSILKRKRETSPEIGAMSSNNDENTSRDGEVVLGSSTSATVSNLPSIRSSEAVKEFNHTTHSMLVSKVEAVEEEEEEGLISEAVKEFNHTTRSMLVSKVEAVEEEEEEGLISEAGEDDQSPAKDTVEMEKGMIVDTAEDRDAENSEQRTEESDYEAVEGEEKEDDDHIYQDDEEMDDDDDDDFARKIGVMYS